MAFVHGKSAVVSIDNAAGVLQNISAYSDNVSGLPGAPALDGVTAFGDQGERSIRGLQNVSFTVSGSYDPALNTIMSGLRTTSATASFEYGPEGSTATKVKFSGECWLTEYTVDSTVAGKVTWSASFQVDGVVTTGTY